MNPASAILASAAVSTALLAAISTPGPTPSLSDVFATIDVEYEDDGHRGLFAGATDTPSVPCDVMIRWQSSAANVIPSKSKVRVKGGLFSTIGRSWGPVLTDEKNPIKAYSNHPMESLFYWKERLNQKCSKNRRYRIRILGKTATNGRTTYKGVARDLYFPSKTGWTRQSNIDLGYIDLCLFDATRCNGPYYPGGNRTPMP